MSSYEYHQILQFLYFEGYADSYESAEELVESLSDEEFEDLCEKKLAHSFPLNKRERKSVENIGRMNRGDYSNAPDEDPTPTRTRSASRPAPKTKKRKTDLSKVIIAQYLYNEGFADTPESGSVMAESVSEQWANQILDEEYKDLTPEKEERVKNRVGELARDIQVQSGRMKDLKKKPFGKYRPKVKQEKEAILKSARKKQKLVQNASDALIRTSTSRSASIQKRIQDLKDQS
jgi:hypothetical protein